MESKLLIQVGYDGTPYIRIRSSKSEEDVRDQLVRRFLGEGGGGPCWLRMISSNDDTGELVFILEPLNNAKFMEHWPRFLEHHKELHNWPENISKKEPIMPINS